MTLLLIASSARWPWTRAFTGLAIWDTACPVERSSISAHRSPSENPGCPDRVRRDRGDAAPDPRRRDAAVVLDEAEGSAEKRLVAYLRHADHAIDKQGRSLQEKLPINMVPALYVELDAFPLTSSGKLNRKALPRPRLCGLNSGVRSSRRGAPLEDLIDHCDLGLDARRGSRGRRGGLFQLGGHSLIAIQMRSRLRDRPGSTCPCLASSIYRPSRSSRPRSGSGTGAAPVAPRQTARR
jgi:hypothetical protein